MYFLIVNGLIAHKENSLGALVNYYNSLLAGLKATSEDEKKDAELNYQTVYSVLSPRTGNTHYQKIVMLNGISTNLVIQNFG